MSGIKKRLTKLVSGIEGNFDKVVLAFRKRMNADDPLQIITYRSYGALNRFYIEGRVLKDKGLPKSTQKDSVLNNLLNMYKRFESDEVPHALLRANFQGKVYTAETDNEGYFRCEMFAENPLYSDDMWHEVEVELIEAPYSFVPGIKTTAHILLPPADAEYGIISDLDDTVIKTNATSLLAMARNTFFHNAHSRLPFAGVAAFYKSLQLGRNGKRNNPFFYVSSSPWNLYDLLMDFLDLNDIPEGPILLRDIGVDYGRDNLDHMGHKFKEIKSILLTYPSLNFILVGDSGQDDPKIYRRIVDEFPDRILAIYIRDVQLADREKIAVEISKEMETGKVEMVIVDNTVEAAEHASRTGLIFTEAIPQIIEDKMLDKGEISGKDEIN